jgi:hypothetical protein
MDMFQRGIQRIDNDIFIGDCHMEGEKCGKVMKID